MNTYNEPSYPCIFSSQGKEDIQYQGLSKRELIAAMAMCALLSGTQLDNRNTKYICDLSITYADAILSQLDKY